MKHTTRRRFLASAITSGAAISSIASFSDASESPSGGNTDVVKSRYELLDQALNQPILKKHLFHSPVIIKTLQLLEYEGNYLCRVRAENGAEGISVAHANMSTLFPIFLKNIQPFFIDQDARELDLILEKIYNFQFNFRLNGLAIGIPLATVEFAVLDMLGKMIQKPVAQLIGEIHNPEIELYLATEFRELPLQTHFERIKASANQFDVQALKIKVGFLYAGTKDIYYSGIPGKSEKLIPMVREYFGDNFTLYADANGYYDAEGAIKIGRLLEEYKFGYFEEPVLYWHFEDTKKVADALTIPIAHGEQDQSFYNFRWLLAHDGIDIVEPDTYYFGGFIRSMKVALMAQAVGKRCLTHMSGGGLGFLYNAVFVSALPNSVIHHEFKGFRTKIPYECPTAEMKITNGKMKVPTGSGLGIIIDPDFVAKHKPVNQL